MRSPRSASSTYRGWYLKLLSECGWYAKHMETGELTERYTQKKQLYDYLDERESKR